MLHPVLAAVLLSAQSMPANNAPVSAPEEQKEAERVICKSEIVTGSRTQRKRTCMTQREWNRTQDATRDAVQDYITRSTSGPTRQ